MTTHYSDQPGFVSKGTNVESNGMTGANKFLSQEVHSTGNEGEDRNQQTEGLPRRNGEVKNGVAKNGGNNGQANDQLSPGTPITYSLRKMARAFQFSVDCDRSKWDFAVEITDLDSLGISHDELRWLIGKGLVEHAREVGDTGGIGRSFDSPGGFSFSSQSCFVLTATGLQLASDLANTYGNDFLNLPIREYSPAVVRPEPSWDDQRNELRLGEVLVKRFKWRAANQEAILAAFQEDGWPARIDDPLSPVPETDPKRRLSDTIKCLNRKQQNTLLRFSGDGTGEGALWDVAEGPD